MGGKARKLQTDSDHQAIIAAKFESVRVKIATCQTAIDENPITFEGIKNNHDDLNLFIHCTKKHYMLE